METSGGVVIQIHVFLTSALGGEWSASRLDCFTPEIHWIGGWVGFRTYLDDVETSRPSSQWPVAIPTALRGIAPKRLPPLPSTSFQIRYVIFLLIWPCHIVQAVSSWLLTAAARVSTLGQIIWDLWWTKWQWGRYSQSTSVSSASSHYTDCPTLIIIYLPVLITDQILADVPSGHSCTSLKEIKDSQRRTL
jgi:hypothetical protein